MIVHEIHGGTWLTVLLTTVPCLTLRASAQVGLPKGAERVAFEQRLGDTVPRDARFSDSSGREVRLGALLERPAILAPVYYECPMLCTELLNGLLRALRSMSLEVGRDFNVISLSFDPSERPDLARRKKDTYLERYGRSGARDGWFFLTGSEREIARVTEAIGFRYQYDAASGEYAHAAGLVVLTPDGRIARVHYGLEHSPRDLRLSLVAASDGRIGGITDQLLLLCYSYDPATGRYGFAVMTALRAGGVLTLLMLGGFIWFAARAERRGRGRRST